MKKLTIFEEALHALHSADVKDDLGGAVKDGSYLVEKNKKKLKKITTLQETLPPRKPKKVLFMNVDSDTNKKRLLNDSVLILDPVLFFKNKYSLLTCSESGVYTHDLMISREDRPKRYIDPIHGPECYFESHFMKNSLNHKHNQSAVFAYKDKHFYRASTDASIYRKGIDRKSKDINDNKSINLTLSFFDDIISDWIVEISRDNLSVFVATDKSGYKELSAIREEPLTATGRKKAVLHWVKNHIRVRNDKEINVSAFTRGIDCFNIADFSIKVSPPALSLLDHKTPEIFEGSMSYDLFTSINKALLK